MGMIFRAQLLTFLHVQKEKENHAHASTNTYKDTHKLKQKQETYHRLHLLLPPWVGLAKRRGHQRPALARVSLRKVLEGIIRQIEALQNL